MLQAEAELPSTGGDSVADVCDLIANAYDLIANAVERESSPADNRRLA